MTKKFFSKFGPIAEIETREMESGLGAEVNGVPHRASGNFSITKKYIYYIFKIVFTSPQRFWFFEEKKTFSNDSVKSKKFDLLQVIFAKKCR